jgi:competence protein ComEA
VNSNIKYPPIISGLFSAKANVWYFLLVLGLSACLPSAPAQAAKQDGGLRELVEVAQSRSVNINKADANELASALKGVGLKRAQDIIVYREKVGGFKSAEQLMDVKGIGAKVFAKNKASVVLE